MVKFKGNKNELLSYIYELHIQGKDIRNIILDIEKKYGITYSARSVEHYISQATREDRIKKYEEQNRLMQKWNGSDRVQSKEDDFFEVIKYKT